MTDPSTKGLHLVQAAVFSDQFSDLPKPSNKMPYTLFYTLINLQIPKIFIYFVFQSTFL